MLVIMTMIEKSRSVIINHGDRVGAKVAEEASVFPIKARAATQSLSQISPSFTLKKSESLEDRIAHQNPAHVALKQDLAVAQHNLRRSSVVAGKIRRHRDDLRHPSSSSTTSPPSTTSPHAVKSSTTGPTQALEPPATTATHGRRPFLRKRLVEVEASVAAGSPIRVAAIYGSLLDFNSQT
ncbi:hypothetical protein ACFX11_003497 [Malus domestica]